MGASLSEAGFLGVILRWIIALAGFGITMLVVLLIFEVINGLGERKRSESEGEAD